MKTFAIFLTAILASSALSLDIDVIRCDADYLYRKYTERSETIIHRTQMMANPNKDGTYVTKPGSESKEKGIKIVCKLEVTHRKTGESSILWTGETVYEEKENDGFLKILDFKITGKILSVLYCDDSMIYFDNVDIKTKKVTTKDVVSNRSNFFRVKSGTVISDQFVSLALDDEILAKPIALFSITDRARLEWSNVPDLGKRIGKPGRPDGSK